jgi:aspartate carbamoyltransferase catalytic subunit
MKHLLSINDVNRDEAINILNTAAELQKLTSGTVKKLPTLRGRTIANLFFEDSTRTRLSFEAAAKRLSADVINFSAKGSSVSKGESLKDTAQTLEAMGVDLFVLRHPASGAATSLAKSGWVDAHIINAGDGTHEHPTQALLDAFTIRKHHGIGRSDFNGVKIAIVGDIAHSRVARSNVLLLKKLGADVTVIAPPTLIPVGLESWGVHHSYDFDEDLASFDVVMMLRVQLERMNDSFFPNGREYARGYGLDESRLNRLKSDAIVMHPGPMNRGLEISSASADSSKSVILEQVAHGVIVRMAVLYRSLGGPDIASTGGSL